MALPCGTTGSLRPGFPPARLVGLAVKLPYAFALYGWFPISLREPLRASVTLWEATAPVKLPTMQCPGQKSRLEFKSSKGGISRSAPQKLTFLLQCLPPILHMLPLNSLQSYSKGAQGLSVLPRVLGIFTESAVSLSPWLRQWGDRYAIRAGRNLPDKEFRYLRTVIVTAAVYRGFGFLLHLRRD